MKDKTRLVVVLILVGVALLVLAGPIGNRLGAWMAPTETENVLPAPKPESARLPMLRLRRDSNVQSPATAVPAEEPKLPAPPRNVVENPRTLSNDEINSALKQKQPQFLRCWTQRLKDNPDLTGKLDMQFEINPRGKVQDARVVDSSVKDEVMPRCILSVLERIQFREFRGGAITLTFPLTFE